MPFSFLRSRSGLRREKGWWPVVALLTLVVLLPTACVLWFMTQAMQNERLAVQQKLVEVYRGQLDVLSDQLDDHWAQRAERLTQMLATTPAPELFARSVDDDLLDSLVVFDEAGDVVYPKASDPVVSDDGEEALTWSQAIRLEQQDNDPLAASQVYAGIASRSADPNQSARALQAQARCLARVQQVGDAIALLTQTLAEQKYQHAVDKRGRLIAADAELRALQLIDSADSDLFRATADRLMARLLDYKGNAMPSPQRRFLMTQLRELDPKTPAFSLFSAEDLAAQWVAADAPPPSGHELQPGALTGVWEMASADGRVLALFKAEALRRRISEWASDKSLPSDVLVEVLPPGVDPTGESPAVSTAGAWMPGWRLSLSLKDHSLFDASAERQITAYLWTGALVIFSTLAMAVLIAWAVRRQIRVARLKNDIVATVSHELKTPLASMRLLIDTLLDADGFDPKRVNEYLHMISRENTRLSRLIENFLTFSRLEQNRYAFNPTDVRPLDVIDAASQAVRDRFQSPGCRLDIEAAPGLPMILGDHDALVTAVVNLLDNAYKYSGEEKHIILRTFARDGQVCFQVQDNGIGISRTGSRNVFKRFYQVDQSLSGISTGVGLGLSIVRAIVQAHHGTIGLDSEIDKGSTFTIHVPASTDVDERVEEGGPDGA